MQVVFAVTQIFVSLSEKLQRVFNFLHSIFVRIIVLSELVKMDLRRASCENEGISDKKRSSIDVHEEKMKENDDGVKRESFKCKIGHTRF